MDSETVTVLKQKRNAPLIDANSLLFLYNHFHNKILKSKRPSYAYITIESICNSKCKYCNMWKTKRGNQPNIKEWKRIIDDIRVVGAMSLTFSGGEPFLNKDLFELAVYARSKGLYTMVVTNFSLFKEEWIPKIAKSFDFFGISIDSTKADVYQETRGVNWLDHIKRGVPNLMDGLATMKAKTAVCAMVTVSNKNADEMHEIIHMIFDELGMDCISFNLLDPKGGPTAKNFVPTEEQLKFYSQTVLDHKGTYPILNSVRYIREAGNYDYKCNPWKCIQIDHEGTLLAPCLFIRGKRFNLRETGLQEVWRQRGTQDIYAQYEKCKLCNLGCVAEAAWSTYDLNFVINESLNGMILPMRRRISERNHHNIKKGERIACTAINLQYPMS